LAGVTAQTMTYPGDVIRRRMQTNGMGGKPPMYSGSLDVVRKVFAIEGVLGFFAGYGANLMKVPVPLQC